MQRFFISSWISYLKRDMISFLVLLFLMKNICADSHLVLSILPIGKNIILEESADLNLTCKVKAQRTTNESNDFCKFDLTWKLPTRSNADGDRITVYEKNDQLTVTIHHLQEDDSGLYVCELQNNGIIRTRKISVFVRSKKCMKQFFDCGSGLCVPKHYVCDGYVDCPSGYDESFKHCGSDACHGKILCDGRCIPSELCCDPAVDVNCSVNYLMPCCHGVLHPGLYKYGIFQRNELDAPPCTSSVDCHFGRFVGFGNSVIYIVASCAVVVMVVSAVVMFLACRVCSRRADELHRWSRVSEHELRRQCLSTPLAHRDIEPEIVDFLFDDLTYNADHYPANSGSDSPQDFVLVNFVEGTGFEIADCGPKPPPYTETTIGIPPPPYESATDIANGDKEFSGNVSDSDAINQSGE